VKTYIVGFSKDVSQSKQGYISVTVHYIDGSSDPFTLYCRPNDSD
jgi:hypothetical protein